jgi:glucose/arabinose dehydrogenase
MLRRLISTCLAAALLVGAARAQTAREAAVAIDAVPIPAAGDAPLQALASGLRLAWSMAFLPDGGVLIVEKHSGVRVLSAGGVLGPLLGGGPHDVMAYEDSGYLDIALDPDFARNRLVYLAFVEGNSAANRTAIWRGRFDGERFSRGQVIFRVNRDKQGPSHPGGRLLFMPDGALLLSVGDGYDRRDEAQDMASHLGKVLRLTRNGAPAPDNPFIGQANVAPEIWTSGHRNIQGLTLDAATGAVWSHEHGPRGGDEINVLRAGANYGWPLVSHGIDYDGSVITPRTHDAAFERSRFFWAPSIAPSGFTLYRGDRYPEFDGRFFVGGLASRSLVRLRMGVDTALLVEEARMYASLHERIRDVRTGPDGLLYILTDGENGRLIRLTPPAGAAAAAPARSTRDLAALVGDWSGNAAFLPAFTPNSAARAEAARAQCRSVLTGNYIQCDIWFRQEDGRERGVMWLWNFNEISGEYELMTLASNYGQASSVQMRWDTAERAFVGLTPASTADGRPALERLVFRISDDGDTIHGFEMMRPNAHIDGAWVQTFEYVLHRAP